MEFVTAVSKRLNAILEEKNVTVGQLANESGVSITTVNGILNGTTKAIRLETFYNLIEILNLTYNDFFNDELFNLNNLERTRK